MLPSLGFAVNLCCYLGRVYMLVTPDALACNSLLKSSLKWSCNIKKSCKTLLEMQTGSILPDANRENGIPFSPPDANSMGKHVICKRKTLHNMHGPIHKNNKQSWYMVELTHWRLPHLTFNNNLPAIGEGSVQEKAISQASNFIAVISFINSYHHTLFLMVIHTHTSKLRQELNSYIN